MKNRKYIFCFSVWINFHFVIGLAIQEDIFILGIGRNIRKLRKGRGLTQSQLAEIMGLEDEFQVRRIELGKNVNPTMKLMIKFANAFEVNLCEIIPE